MKMYHQGQGRATTEMSQKRFIIVLPGTVIDDSCGDLAKSIKELLHMWDEKK